jgi:thioredoxin-like negative regulator of GroEL
MVMSPITIQNILDRARGASRIGDHKETERLLRIYLQQQPKNREARLLLGTTLAKMGRLDQAANILTLKTLKL